MLQVESTTAERERIADLKRRNSSSREEVIALTRQLDVAEQAAKSAKDEVRALSI
jgi:hypothetical protein